MPSLLSKYIKGLFGGVEETRVLVCVNALGECMFALLS